MTDARLRELYERALVRRAEGPDARERERCPDPAEILMLIRREGPEAQRLQVLDHVMSCASCRGEFDLLRAIERAGAEGGTTGRSDPRGGWRRGLPFALAASVLLAVGIGVASRVEWPGGPDVERGDEGEVTLLAPADEVSLGAAVSFVWRAVPDARRYELEVVTKEGAVVFAASTADTTLTLSDPTRLLPGAEYRWGVRAWTDAGVQRASPLRRFRTRGE